MIISRDGNLFIIKIYKENIYDFDIYDTNDITDLFKDILIKIKKKYKINGLCDIDVYINDKYGMIMEINNIYKYGKDLDVKISFHIDSYFMNEIEFDIDDIDDYLEVYYYNNKYYTICDRIRDSDIIYKDSFNIINKGIRIK